MHLDIGGHPGKCHDEFGSQASDLQPVFQTKRVTAK